MLSREYGRIREGFVASEPGERRIKEVLVAKGIAPIKLKRTQSAHEPGKRKREGTPGFEPGTIRTAAECSTTELRTH